MIKRPKPERFRLRRTMMFMNAQKPGLIKDAYIYGCDSIMLDLEDAVAENQKDAARFSLYHALTTIDYGSTEVIVRINGLDTPTGRRTSGCAWLAVPTASVLPSAKAHRMCTRLRPLWKQPRRNSAWKWAGRC